MDLRKLHKASGGDGVPFDPFQILKDDAVKMPANLENSARLEKVSFHSSPKERQCQRILRLPHNSTHLTREVAQSYLTLCDPMDYSLPGSSVHGIFQARVLEWVAISFSRGSSQPRD